MTRPRPAPPMSRKESRPQSTRIDSRDACPSAGSTTGPPLERPSPANVATARTWNPATAKMAGGSRKKPEVMARTGSRKATGLESPPVPSAMRAAPTAATARLSQIDSRSMPSRRARTASTAKKPKVRTDTDPTSQVRHGLGSVQARATTSVIMIGTKKRRTPTARPKSRFSSWRWISAKPWGGPAIPSVCITGSAPPPDPGRRATRPGARWRSRPGSRPRRARRWR